MHEEYINGEPVPGPLSVKIEARGRGAYECLNCGDFMGPNAVDTHSEKKHATADYTVIDRGISAPYFPPVGAPRGGMQFRSGIPLYPDRMAERRRLNQQRQAQFERPIEPLAKWEEELMGLNSPQATLKDAIKEGIISMDAFSAHPDVNYFNNFDIDYNKAVFLTEARIVHSPTRIDFVAETYIYNGVRRPIEQ